MDTGGTSTLRRWVLLTLALALTTIGIVVPSSLAQADRPDGGQENPDLSASCGTDVVVILDESGSIEAPGGGQPSAIPEVENAVRALVAGLNGTGSQMRIVEFSTNARDAQVGTTSDFQTVDNDFVTAVNSYLTGGGNTQSGLSYNPSQTAGNEFYTNWEAALNEAATVDNDSVTTPEAGDSTPLVVFITDGGPNTTGTNGGSLGSGGAAGDQASADAAINEMARLQLAGSHVLSIGVGQASTNTTLFNRLGNLTEPGTLQSWAGPPAPLDIGTVDIIDAGDFGEGTLEEALQEIVFALCGSSLTIHKTNDLGAPIAAHNFDLTVQSLSGGGTGLEWELPDDGGVVPVPATESVATGDDGIANFKWTPGSVADPEPWDSTVVFTETLPPGWGLGEVTCTVGQTVLALVPTVDPETRLVTVGPFTIGRDEAAVCDVENIRPPAIDVVKTAVAVGGVAVTPPATVPASGGSVTYRVDVANLSQEPLTLTSLVDDVFGNLAGVSDSTCAVGGTIAVGATYTCEFTRVVVQPDGPEAPPSHVNIVTGTAVDADGNPATDFDDETVNYVADDVFDVGIVKTASGVPDGTLSNGEQFTYTLTVTNNGNVAATNVVVTDNVPARLRVDAVSVPGGWTNLSSGNAVSLRVDSLAPSASVDAVLTVTLLPAAVPAPIEIQDGQPAPEIPDLAIENIVNQACVDADVDTVPGNDCNTETVPVDDIVAVVYVRCVNDAPLLGYAVQTTPSLAGEPITLTWRPNNPTAQTSPQEVVLALQSGDADEIAWPGAVFTSGRVSIDWPGWRPIQESDYVNGSLSHHPADNIHNGMILDSNEPDYAWRDLTTVSFEVNPAITFTAGYPDATPECIPQRSSALTIQKTSSVASINGGQSFSYTIDVTNVSLDGAAEPVVLTDPIPSQIRVDQIVTSTTAFPRWTNCLVTGRDSEGYGGQLRCDLFGALLMGASAPQVRLEVTARPTASGAVTNTAVVSWQLADVPDSPLLFVDDAATVTVNAVSVQPPAPSAPVLPPTGSSSTQPLIGLALLALLGGATILFVSRRRNQPMSG